MAYTIAELKTKSQDSTVTDFLNQISDVKKRQDCFTLVQLMQQATGAEAIMWGDSIVGFGSYHYQYASGRGATEGTAKIPTISQIAVS